MAGTPLGTAAERNKQPILEVLLRVLPAMGKALEIASGTGQHVAWFAAAMPGWTWQPTEFDASALSEIAACVTEAQVSNVRPPLRLDVMAPQWPAGAPEFDEAFDAIYCANMLHISPWATCAALMQGAARHLAPAGVLVTYGPYLEDDVATAPGNLSFDQSLRERHAMPANNLLLVFARAA